MQTEGDFARDGYTIVRTPIFPAAVIDRASAGIAATLAGMARVTEYTDVVTGKRIKGLTTDSHGPPVTLASDGVPELLAHPYVHPNNDMLVPPATHVWPNSKPSVTVNGGLNLLLKPAPAQGTREVVAAHHWLRTAARMVGAVLRQTAGRGRRWLYRAAPGLDKLEPGGQRHGRQCAPAAMFPVRMRLRRALCRPDDSSAACAAEPNGFSGSGLFTCWVALSEVRPDSAPLQFVRGSHRWGVKYQDKATHRQDRPTQQREFETPTVRCARA